MCPATLVVSGWCLEALLRSGQVPSAVRRPEVQIRTQRHDSGGIDLLVRDVVMPLDVIEIHRLRDPVDLVQIPEIAEELGIVDDPAHVALEVPVIHGIEPDQRDEQAPIRLDEFGAE